MPHSPQIGEGFADWEIMEGLGLCIAWGMEGELGAVMADKGDTSSMFSLDTVTLSNSKPNTVEALPLWYNIFHSFLVLRS
jgi:hypothetical protein